MKFSKPKIAISIGDVNGVGPEILVKAFSQKELLGLVHVVVYGSALALDTFKRALRVEKFHYNKISKAEASIPRKLNLIEVAPDLKEIEIGKATPASGKVAYLALSKAVEDLKAGKVHALVTLPIEKSAIQNEEFNFPGHTEYLTKEFGGKDALMFMLSDSMRIGVVSGHVPLKDVSKEITVDRIMSKLKIMNESLSKDFDLPKPTIAVLGLNPHAGDNGHLGNEEEEVIIKAIKRAEREGIMALGPYPADGFFATDKPSKFDGILAMYHDQGLIPFKMSSRFTGVNFTAGLDFIRTSPDHGVAYDLAGRGLVNIDSFLQALYTAQDIVRSRGENALMSENPLPVQSQRRSVRR